MKWNIAKISMPEPKNLPKAEETLCDIQNEKTSFLDRAIKLFNLSNFIKSGKKEEIETAVAETDYDKSRAWIPVALSYLKGFALTLAVCLAGHYFLGVVVLWRMAIWAPIR
jgi:hypothetical protein